jgi:hypothetical protein
MPLLCAPARLGDVHDTVGTSCTCRLQMIQAESLQGMRSLCLPRVVRVLVVHTDPTCPPLTSDFVDLQGRALIWGSHVLRHAPAAHHPEGPQHVIVLVDQVVALPGGWGAPGRQCMWPQYVLLWQLALAQINNMCGNTAQSTWVTCWTWLRAHNLQPVTSFLLSMAHAVASMGRKGGRGCMTVPTAKVPTTASVRHWVLDNGNMGRRYTQHSSLRMQQGDSAAGRYRDNLGQASSTVSSRSVASADSLNDSQFECAGSGPSPLHTHCRLTWNMYLPRWAPNLAISQTSWEGPRYTTSLGASISNRNISRPVFPLRCMCRIKAQAGKGRRVTGVRTCRVV